MADDATQTRLENEAQAARDHYSMVMRSTNDPDEIQKARDSMITATQSAGYNRIKDGSSDLVKGLLSKAEGK